VGRLGLAITVLVLATAPAFLFFDPVDFIPREWHVPREPRSIYLLYSDDVAYVSASLNWSHTLSNLFVPHNTHIVPAWRLLTWALVTVAGSLERLPEVLAIASYSILVAVMLLIARLVARETGRTLLGLVAMVLVGTTSLMLTPSMWYSAGQPLWAGLGVLATLWYAQSYRRSGRSSALALAAASAPLAGWFWTVGHLAGPVAAVYLWIDGRRRCRLAAAVPLAASLLAVALGLALGGRRIDSTISFHGRTMRDAANPVRGLLDTGQAIPENLVFANLGLTVHTTPTQGALLSLSLVLLWSSRWWFGLLRPHCTGASLRQSVPSYGNTRAFCPLECAGAALVLGSYLIEWTVRGYMDYPYLRTIGLRFAVPWYDVLPQIGAVLFTAGWWSATRATAPKVALLENPRSATRMGTLGLGLLAVVLIVLNRPRVDALFRSSAPRLLPSDRRLYPLPHLQTMRANVLLISEAQWQRGHLRRLDQVEATARRIGLGRDAIRAAFGHPWIPATTTALRPSRYDLYDAVAVLDLPEHGRKVDTDSVRRALAEWFVEDRPPRPFWLDPKEPWPPPDELPPAAE